MKNSRLLIILISLFAYIILLNSQNVVAEEDSDITTQIENAKTPDDHLKLADYYDTEAAKMESMASMHDSMAKAYQYGGKTMSPMANHCENISKELRESAEQYKALSSEHRKMAQEMNN